MNSGFNKNKTNNNALFQSRMKQAEQNKTNYQASFNLKKTDKRIWEHIIVVSAHAMVLFGLIVASIVSFLQTMEVFKPFREGNIFLGNWNIGVQIPIAFAFIFQYGQNVVLYWMTHFADKKRVLYRIGNISIYDGYILPLTIFIVFALIDGGTNCLWLYELNLKNPQSDSIIRTTMNIIGYPTMILLVFVEEIIGKVLEAFMRSIKTLREMLKLEEEKSKSRSTSTGTSKIATNKPDALPSLVTSKPHDWGGIDFQKSLGIDNTKLDILEKEK